MTEKEKEILIRGCIKGKKRAFSKLYNFYAPKMLGVCMRYGKSREDAEDILQEGFVRVFKNIGTYGHKGSFDGWIRRVMVNTAINHYHKNKRYYENELEISDNRAEPGDNDEPEDDGYRELDIPKEKLMKMINELPEGYKMVFNLYVFEGMKHIEIAKLLGISQNTSKTQLMKARKRLKNAIEKMMNLEKRVSYER